MKPGLSLAACCALLFLGVLSHAQLLPGNLLVSNGKFNTPANVVREYTPAGVLVKNFDVPFPGGRPGSEDVRDTIVDASGNIQIYNGTFTPYLTTLNPTTSTFDHHTTPGLSTIANVSFGGIATYKNFVYLTDMATFGREDAGIVRFDTTTFTFERFGIGNNYSDLTLGLDNRLYAINGSTVSINVFEPTTMTQFPGIPLPGILDFADLRGIAVDASGILYGAGADGSIYQFDNTGTVLNSRAMGVGRLMDIDLGPGGQLVAGGRSGDVVLTTTSLSSHSSFQAGNGNVHVAFTSPAHVSIGGIIALQGMQNALQSIDFTFRPSTGSAFTRTTTLNSAGGYNLEDIPAGNYQVSIKGAKWLRKNITVDARSRNVTNANAMLRAGDANNDNFIDIADLLLLVAAYNKISPDAGYSEAVDFNNDGIDDINDLLLLIGNYNHRGDF